MTKNMDIERVLGDVSDLPTLPRAASAILHLVDDPKTNAQDVNRILAKDTAMASKILRLVNSAYYGLPKKISNLNQAIVILGFSTLKSVALSASVVGLFSKQVSSSQFDREAAWKHAIAVACVAKVVAGKQPDIDPELAFSAGILHDMGKLLLDEYFPVEMKEIMDNARQNSLSFVESETTLVDTNHAAIGAWLAEKWQLPSDLVDAIRTHEDIEQAQNAALAATLLFAHYICALKKLDSPGTFKPPAMTRPIWEALGLDKKVLPGVLAVVNKEIKAAEDFLDLGAGI